MSADESSPDPNDAVGWYDHHAEAVVKRHESLAPKKINTWLESLLPSRPALVLDVGAGSGRDAAWLVSLGHQVIAVEPSEQMRVRGRSLHAAEKIRWINDRLPGLENVHRLGLPFDFILLNAVWMHVPPANRRRAFPKLITLLKPGGWMAISFRQPDPGNPGQCSHVMSMNSSSSPGSTVRSSKGAKRRASSYPALDLSGHA
ncbi:MAG: class I SAM-dependent methyltransferase [Chthoniobacterales bacterium]